MNNGRLDSYKPEETAIIILGDAGFNYHLNKYDIRLKKEVNELGFYIYCVRGNHECRPIRLLNMSMMFDENVNGPVYYEPEYPHIRYFRDYDIYTINGYRCLVIGGAYSVDKWYRLGRFNMTEATNIAQKSGWFNDECLSRLEMIGCENMIENSHNNIFDFVFTHTCPKKYQPTDLFLGFVDQSKVDTSMEDWMDIIAEKIVVNFAWCFGHYHADRLERPHVEQYFNDIENLDTIYKRWVDYDNNQELDWWLEKSPNFYKGIGK